MNQSLSEILIVLNLLLVVAVTATTVTIASFINLIKNGCSTKKVNA